MKQVLMGIAAIAALVLIGVGVSSLVKGPPENIRSICPIIVFEDGTWVEDGWDSSEGFPPVGCVLSVRLQHQR